MNKKMLAKKIYEISNIKGQFKLRSGKTSTEYFDKYLFEGNPKILSTISKKMKKMIRKKYDCIAGLEMGGIPVATALSLLTGIPAIFVRKKAKKYGTCKLAEGADINGKTLLIIEDVVTSGGAILDAARELRKINAKVKDVFCVILREEIGKENLKKEELDLYALFTKKELEE